MSRVLREQGCTVVGIEIDPQAAQTAADNCERVIIGDLDYLDFHAELGDDRFDVVLAADVLEHLKDPLSVMQAIKQFLMPHGHVVISVPNVAHISVRLALLSGRFPYGKAGLLDETHLRFLTRESLERLMDDADLAIAQFERINVVPGDPSCFEVPYDPAILPPALLEEIMRDPDAMTYQFVVSGYPLPESRLTFIRDRIKSLVGEAEAARSEAARLRVELELANKTIQMRETEVESLKRDGETFYKQFIERIREIVRSCLPEGGNVLVLSKGDDDLIQIDPCRGYHFPQSEDGTYAGYSPVDGVAAVEHLKEVRKRGAQFLLIPQTSLWWLDEYRELADYLDGHCTRIIDERGVCVMFEWKHGDSE
jgi:SAM-dependent methyltransferase